jgi:hypothetical protein
MFVRLHLHYRLLGTLRYDRRRRRGTGDNRVHLPGEWSTRESHTSGSADLFLSQFNGFYAIGFTAIGNGLYPLEILPFGLRTKGFAITGFVALAAAFFNIFVNPRALESL